MVVYWILSNLINWIEKQNNVYKVYQLTLKWALPTLPDRAEKQTKL